MHKETSPCRTSYNLSFCYVKYYYIVSEICIGGRFSEDCFHCYSQQITIATESLIPYNITKKTPETQNILIIEHRMSHQTISKYITYNSVFGTKDFVPHKFKQ